MEEPLSLLSSAPLREALRGQLAKDLRCPLAQIPALPKKPWLAQYLAQNYHGDQSALAQLLYRVDLSEERLRERALLDWDFLAQALLEREARKVLWRLHSGKN